MKKRDAINFRCTTALRQRIRALRREGENLTATITRLLEAGCRAEEETESERNTALAEACEIVREAQAPS